MMMWKQFAFLGLLGVTLPLFNNPVFPQNILVENSEIQENKIFFCEDISGIPTTFINLEKEQESKIFIRWYSEYLMPEDSPQELCENVSNILNEKVINNEPVFLAAEPLDNRWKICLVSETNGKCSDDKSEDLLYLNQVQSEDSEGNLRKKYPNVAKCFINSISPDKCQSVRTRGTLLSIPSNRYVPNWWPF